MLKRQFIYFISLSLITFLFSSNDNHNFNINVIEQNKDYIIINYSINNYNIEEIDQNGEILHNIILDGEPKFLINGFPSLPHINRSIIIPDNLSGTIRVLNSEFIEIEDLNINPS